MTNEELNETLKILSRAQDESERPRDTVLFLKALDDLDKIITELEQAIYGGKKRA